MKTTKDEIVKSAKSYIRSLDFWRRIEVHEQDFTRRMRAAQRKWNAEQSVRMAVGLPRLGKKGAK